MTTAQNQLSLITLPLAFTIDPIIPIQKNAERTHFTDLPVRKNFFPGNEPIFTLCTRPFDFAQGEVAQSLRMETGSYIG